MIGPLFEHFIILELYRLNDYLRKDFRFSYVATQGGLEVDLVVERPGLPTVFVEIKSTSNVREDHLKHLQSLSADFPEYEAMCLCRESSPRKIGTISVLPWKMGIEFLGL
jgi:predicted AAA+ superfamily ATPase